MDFRLLPEQEMCRDLFRKFALAEVAPLANEIDEEERFPAETVKKMAKAGFFGIPFPDEWGGQGADFLSFATCVEELSRACATTGVILSSHSTLCTWPIFAYGTQAQKKRYLPPLNRGEKLGAFGLTEAGAGTDASGMQTRAVLDGDCYVLNGSKLFITNAGPAEIYIILASTAPAQRTRGISAFIVEKGWPGFSVGKKEKKMGIRGSSTAELIFENCRVPKENLLGAEGKGFGIAMKTLDGGRIGIAAQALGIAQGALDKAVVYTKERRQFGQSIAAFQNTQFTLADMETRVDASRLLVYRAADCLDRGLSYNQEAAKAKLFASETAQMVTSKAVQLHGGYGYMRDYEVERMMRDAKITEIYEGTSEVQRMVISSALLK